MNLVSLYVAVVSQIGPNPSGPADNTVSNRLSIVEQHVGSGKELVAGDKVTILYRAWDSLNREFANSTKRGMPYTLIVGMRNSDPLVSVSITGMHAGGIRTVLIPSNLVPDGVGSIVPPKTDLHLWIYVIAAKATSPPKVDSAHVKRTQGIVEIPRTPLNDGSART